MKKAFFGIFVLSFLFPNDRVVNASGRATTASFSSCARRLLKRNVATATLAHASNRERQRPEIIKLFLEGLGASFPLRSKPLSDDFFATNVRAKAVRWFLPHTNQVQVISVRQAGETVPLGLFFINEAGEKCAMRLFPDYERGPHQDAFNRFLYRKGYHIHFFIKIHEFLPITDLTPVWTLEDSLPLFPSVYSYQNPYVVRLLKAVIPQIKRTDKRILVIGSGSGIDAVTLSRLFQIEVHAIDINPIAVANTKASTLTTGTSVRAWVSDVLKNVSEQYDYIVADLPLPQEVSRSRYRAMRDYYSAADRNKHDLGGYVLRSLLTDLPRALRPGGGAAIMSYADLSSYLEKTNLQSRLLDEFKDGGPASLGIHELWNNNDRAKD